MQQKQIKDIQVYNTDGELILEFSKNYTFPAKSDKGRVVDDVLIIRGKKLLTYTTGTEVEVVVNLKNNDRVKYFCFVEFSTARRLDLKLNAAQAEKLEDKRRFYKVRTEVNCRIHSATRDEETVVFKPTSLYGRIQDINIGGVFLSVDDNVIFEKEDQLSVSAVLGDNKLNASARVLRVQRDKEGEVIGYGCAFIAVDSQQEEIVASYVTRVQIEQRKIERERELLEKELLLRY
jgi:c-di-GMP-binding flagellar brake protein YcgR